jgi:mitochondrial fission protein ELM1
MLKNQKIWVLVDDRAGNRAQIIGLAQNLSDDFEIKEIQYNNFIKIPNFLKFGFLIGISKETKKYLLKNKNIPDIIISAGRRSAILSSYLKKKFSNIYNIHLMSPDLSFDKFSQIILPNHDGIKKNHLNISYINGALHKINTETIKQNFVKHQKFFTQFSQPLISVLIGGNSKNKNFSAEKMQELLILCQNISHKYGYPILFFNSRRTNREMSKVLENFLTENQNHQLYHHKQKNSHEIYLASLYTSKIIITTGDSISMCSESCASGKYIFIYSDSEFCSKKHLKFHNCLFQQNYAQKLSCDVKLIKNKKLNETVVVAQKIIDSFA